MSRLPWWLLFACFPAWAVRFEIKDAGLRNLLYLISEAPLEKILGQCNGIDGWIEVNPLKVREGIKGQLVVDLRALETGSEARNELIRDKVLSAPEHPIVVYEFSKHGKATGESLKKDVPVVVRAEGQLKLKGIVRAVPIFLRLFYFTENDYTRGRLPGNLLKVSASFDLNLTDFGYQPEPSARVAPILHLSFDAVGTDFSVSSVIVPAPDGPKPKEKETRIPLNRAPAYVFP